MYDIFIKNNNSVVADNKTKILLMQHSSMVDKLRILVAKSYNNEFQDMSEFTCVMEYRLPYTKKYKVEVLDRIPDDPDVEDKYSEFIKYAVPINSEITKEAGDVEIQFAFVKKAGDNYSSDDDNIIRRTDKTVVTISPIADWANAGMDIFEEKVDEILNPPIPSV